MRHKYHHTKSTFHKTVKYLKHAGKVISKTLTSPKTKKKVVKVIQSTNRFFKDMGDSIDNTFSIPRPYPDYVLINGKLYRRRR